MEQSQQSRQSQAPKRGWLVMYFLIVVAAFVAVGGTAAGVYYLQQGQIDQLAAENEKLSESHRATPVAKTLFSEPQVPFAFRYLADWSYSVSGDLSVAVNSPGTVYITESSGLTRISKGARIVVTSSPTILKKVDDTFTGVYANVKDKKPVQVAGLDGVEYVLRHGSDQALATSFIKDGHQYSIVLTTEGDELTSPYLADYRALVGSFTF